MKWEYKVATIPSVTEREEFITVANVLGKEGWEIVNVEGGMTGDKRWVSIVVFKREIKPDI